MAYEQGILPAEYAQYSSCHDTCNTYIRRSWFISNTFAHSRPTPRGLTVYIQQATTVLHRMFVKFQLCPCTSFKWLVTSRPDTAPSLPSTKFPLLKTFSKPARYFTSIATVHTSCSRCYVIGRNVLGVDQRKYPCELLLALWSRLTNASRRQ